MNLNEEFKKLKYIREYSHIKTNLYISIVILLNTIISFNIFGQQSMNKYESTNCEKSKSGVYKFQPGAIKNIKILSKEKWIIEIDLLIFNPKWLPGVDSTGGIFLNQNSEIKKLTIDYNTKKYKCSDGLDNNPTTPDVLIKTLDYISHIQKYLKKNKNATGHIVSDFIAYFDIDGDKIITVYDQCLP